MDAGPHVPDVDQLAKLCLDIYATREGRWNPDYGDVEIPDGWAFLPSGDAFLTRTVKAGGVYWRSWQPRSRNRPHRRLLGVWAPADVVRAAEQLAGESAARRAARREQARRAAAGHERHYQDELGQAIVQFLDFSAEHAELARRIAADATAHAAVVGSGRVGRTRLRDLPDRATLAVRAHIRHQYTDYHDELDKLPLELWEEDDLYREIKGAANDAVDEFLDEHRR